MRPLGERLSALRAGPAWLLSLPGWLTGQDRDLRLLRSIVLVIALALVAALLTIRKVEEHLLRAEATGAAVHWAQFLQSRLIGFDEILAAGLVSEVDRQTLEFAGAAGGVRDYQVIRSDGVVALSSWSGDFRGAIDSETVLSAIRDERILTSVSEETVAGQSLVVGQAYVPLSAATGRQGALKVDVDMTQEARRFRNLGNGAFLMLIALLLPPGCVCAWLIRRNIREQRQSEQLQRQRGQVLEEMAKGAGLDEVLERIAGFAEEHHQGARCSIRPLRFHEQRADLAVSETLVGSAWSAPLRATSGVLLGSFELACANAERARTASLGPAGALAQLAALAIECHQAESALHEMRQRHELILTAAGDGIFGVDEEARITFANPAAARMLARVAPEMIGLDAGALIDSPAAAGLLAETLRDGQSRHIEQIAFKRSSGDEFPVDLMVTPVLRGAADLKAVVVFHDISTQIQAQLQLRRAKDEAETASRTKSRFLAHMSHELRTPLNAIIGFSEIMAQQRLGPIESEPYLEYAGDIHASGEHLLSLINDLLDLSKIEAGKLELAEQTVDLPALIERCVAFVSGALRTRELTLEVKIEPGLATAFCDERKLKQVVVNLLSNAVKFTAPGGTIVIAARREGVDDLRVEVADDGIGIAPEHQHRAMEPFGQIEDSLSRDHSGTGLGLPLSKALVELHGGTLTLESAPGRGTTVAIRLPGRAAESGRARSSA